MTEAQFENLKVGDRVVWIGVGDEDEQPGVVWQSSMESVDDEVGEEIVLDIQCDDGYDFPVRVSDCDLLRKEG